MNRYDTTSDRIGDSTSFPNRRSRRLLTLKPTRSTPRTTTAARTPQTTVGNRRLRGVA